MAKIIRNINDLHGLVENCRKGNNTITMVNGCFDLIHAGHINLFEYAKSCSNKLFVCVNSDQSIKNLKGSIRPIFSEESRLYILSSIIYNDYIILFNDDTPAELIDIIKPDIIIKEKEYENKKIAEINTIIKNKCKLIFYEKKYNISTSDVIKKIKNN